MDENDNLDKVLKSMWDVAADLIARGIPMDEWDDEFERICAKEKGP